MKKKILILLTLLVLLTGCNKKEDNNVVNVLNWSSYIPDSVITDFEKEYGIKVNYGTYSSNEELLAKITSSKEGTYDVIFPSDYMVELMRDRGLIEKMDISKISNYSNLNSIFLNQNYDPHNEYSLPFLTTEVVIAVNRENISDNVNSYNDLLNEKYKNDVVLLDDQRIVIGMALLAKQHDMNDTDKNHLNDAKKWLLDIKRNVKAYDSDSPKTLLITKEADLGAMWNAEAELAKDNNPNIEIIEPMEGHAISTDNYCIVKGAKNTENAYLFIDYLMRLEVGKKIVKEYPYISPLLIEQESKIPLESLFTNGFYVKNIGESIKDYDKLWADIK